MRSSTLRVITILFALTAVSPAFAATEFTVSVEQDGVMQPLDSGTIVLDRKPFNLVFTADDGIESFQVNGDLTPKYMRALRAGKPAEDIPPFMPGSGMAEDMTPDPSLTIRLDGGASHYWFRPKDEGSRFHEYEDLNGKWKAVREINEIYLVDYRKPLRKISMKDMRKSLYLSVVASTPQLNERGRTTARLVFRKR